MREPPESYRSLEERTLIEIGVGPLKTMSTNTFKLVLEPMGFDVSYVDAMRDIARTFAENALPSICQSTPMRKASETFDEAGLFAAWNAAFDEFEHLGAADGIWQWMTRMWRDRQTDHVTDSGWLNMLFEWALDRTAEPCPLPRHVQQDIKILLLQHFLKDFETYIKHKYIFEDETVQADVWETYILKTCAGTSFINNVVGSQARLATWRRIFGRLTRDEIEDLDAWGNPLIWPAHRRQPLLIVAQTLQGTINL